jgi:maltodextrin utilization protein YvdJ
LSEKEKYFRLDTKQDGYYCENNNCKKINYDKAIKVKNSESLKIKKQDNTLTDFYFKDNCWGNCSSSKNNNSFLEYQESNKNNVPIFLYIFLAIISILIFILIILIKIMFLYFYIYF